MLSFLFLLKEHIPRFSAFVVLAFVKLDLVVMVVVMTWTLVVVVVRLWWFKYNMVVECSVVVSCTGLCGGVSGTMVVIMVVKGIGGGGGGGLGSAAVYSVGVVVAG